RVRVVIHREDPAENVGADAEGIPKARGQAPQFSAVGRTPKDMAAIAFSRDGGSVGAFELIGSTEVFSHAEEQIALRIKGQAGKTVVGIISLGLQKHKALLLVGLADSMRVAKAENFIPCGQIDRAIG